MATFPMTRVRVGAASSAAVVTLLVTAALGNQALSSWRTARESSGAWNGWVSVLFQPTQLVGWRFSAPSGTDGTDHWLAPLVFNVVLVVGATVLVALTSRSGGRLAAAAATWGAVTLVGGIAAAVCTPLAYAGVRGPAAQAFALSVPLGLSLGFILGFIAALLALVFGGEGAPASNSAE
ncbi:hypothetical protein KDL01_36840, partial [Actinospica durhamensis]